MRHPAFGAEVGQGQQAAARFHHRHGALADGGERIARDVQGLQEGGPWRVEVAAAQVLLVSEADGMDEKVQTVPALAQGCEGVVDAGFLGDVAWDDKIRTGLGGERTHPALQRVALEGEGEFGALGGTGRGDAPGQRTVVGDSHDEAAFAAHQVALGGKLCRSTDGHDDLSRATPGCVRLDGRWWHKVAVSDKRQKSIS